VVTPGVVDTAFFERRKVPYQRQHPQLMSAQTAANAIVEAVKRGRDEIVIPQWLSFPARLKVNFPGLYRRLAARLA
jgi:short-subunit dehydrogenase